MPCCVCQKPKNLTPCDLCGTDVCRNCAVILPDESFKFLPHPSADLLHRRYCGPCFDRKVAPELASYTDTLEKAKKVLVFTRKKSEETRWIRRIEKPLQVTDCLDREEVHMRLAFAAALLGHNALVDVSIRDRKVRNHAYQTTRWDGSGVPVTVDPSKVVEKP